MEGPVGFRILKKPHHVGQKPLRIDLASLLIAVLILFRPASVQHQTAESVSLSHPLASAS